MKMILFLAFATASLLVSIQSQAESNPSAPEWNSLLEQVVQTDSTPSPDSRSSRSPLSASALWAASNAQSRNIGLRLRYLIEDNESTSLAILAGLTRETSPTRSAQGYRLGLTSEAEMVSWKNALKILTSADAGAEYTNGWRDTEGAYRDLAPLSYVGALGISFRLASEFRFSPFVRIAHEWYFKKDSEKRAVAAELGMSF